MRDFVLSDEVRYIKALSTKNATAAKRKSVTVTNIKTNEISEYISMTKAGKAIGVSKAAISQALINNTIIKKNIFY